jgi:predicted RNA-binding protein with PIN domain
MPKKSFNNNKLRNKIEILISKYEKRNAKQEKILKLSKNTQKELGVLLSKIPEESNEIDNGLNKELTQIHKNFKQNMKLIKIESKKERKEFKRQKKELNKFKKQKKEQNKIDLDGARIEELPELKENELESIKIIVDGWNITGCDKIARKSMRGKRGQGAKRMIYLLSQFGLNNKYILTNKNINLEIHFDGNGKSGIQLFCGENENNVSIDVKYSGKSEIVDDRLVRELSVSQKTNGNIIVVTSDRELTLRLNKIGVKCMKSGCFYKKYLKEYAFDGLESEGSDKNNKNSNYKIEKSEKGKPKKGKYDKSDKHEKRGKGKRGGRHGKKHWKKYIKNRFSDNSSSSSSGSSSSSSSDSDYAVINKD